MLLNVNILVEMHKLISIQCCITDPCKVSGKYCCNLMFSLLKLCVLRKFNAIVSKILNKLIQICIYPLKIVCDKTLGCVEQDKDCNDNGKLAVYSPCSAHLMMKTFDKFIINKCTFYHKMSTAIVEIHGKH